MATQRTVQHKERREERRNQELQELRSEVRQLKRLVERLRKENLRLRAVATNAHDTEDEVPVPPPETGPTCSKCKSKDVKDIRLPVIVLRVCVACGHREKVV